MRINWFSPSPPLKTGIANYTAVLLPILSKNAEITLWIDQKEYDQNLEKFANIKIFDVNTVNRDWLNNSDLNIYNIGNNIKFHSWIWKISTTYPGLVIVHDLKLQHFFTAFFQQENKEAQYLLLMKQIYGEDSQKVAKKYLDGIIPIDSLTNRYPLTDLAIQNSLGVVTHSLEEYQSIKQKNKHAAIYIPLPYHYKQISSKNNNKLVLEKPYQLIVFGHIGNNRCLEIIIDALFSFKRKNHFHLNVYGEIWNEKDIKKKIKELALSGIVTIHGFTEEQILNKALETSDLAINLRYPSMGEASLSQLQIWSHALPSIVTLTGWYRMLSSDIVNFVRPNHEISDIHDILNDFLNNPQTFIEKGVRGEEFLKEEHSPENYVRSLLEFSKTISNKRSNNAGFYLIDRTSQELQDWLEFLPKASTLLDRVSESIHFLTFSPISTKPIDRSTINHKQFHDRR